MQLVYLFSPSKLIYVVIFLTIGNAEAASNDVPKLQQVNDKTAAIAMEQKSVKKDLKLKLAEETTPLPEKHDHTEKAMIKDKSLADSAVKMPAQDVVPKSEEKTVTESISLKPQHHQHFLDEDFVVSDEDDISESLKTGFYFFLILSSGAIVFIIFKIYRLRLSRAERKYGVQGDRCTQELTPLPISIEDGHSDDEDIILFEIQRQNIRIL